jgi:hypothetical protein
VLADDLRTTFGVAVVETRADWEARANVWRDPRAVVGASDAGAHMVGCGPIHTRFDLPAGAGRLYAEAVGIQSVPGQRH